jgi:dihydrolipoamide dehydrogenase
VVIGGGIIGLEIASYFNSIGSTVTIIEILDHIAQDTDREISEILKKNYEKKGIKFILNAKVTEVKDDSIIYESNGEIYILHTDKVLLSAGRKPVIDNLGLEKINVEIDKGRIKTDETGKTNIPNVYAVGDVNGTSMLAHTAYREAEVCINNILGKKDIMRYHAIPSVIYTNPEVASVGETEESAKNKGINYEVQKISMRYSGRYLAENEGGDGICKIILDKKYKKIIGAQIIGNYSSEIIYGVSFMIETEMRIKDIKELVFPHPTVSEIIRETIFQF